jgi:hypothetical protein
VAIASSKKRNLKIVKNLSEEVHAVSQTPMFLGLLDPDPLVTDTDPDPGPSIIKQNSKKNFGSYCFVDPYQNGTDPQNCLNRLRKSHAIVPLICVIKKIYKRISIQVNVLGS